MSEIDDLLAAANPLGGLPDEDRARIESWVEAELLRERERTKREAAKRRSLEHELALSFQRYEDLLTIVHGEVQRPQLNVQRKGDKSEACAVLLWSDWHVDERVTPEVTAGLNEYSIEIAWQRVQSLVERTRWQVESWQRLSTLDTLVVAALGDWIAGDIHPELAETALPPQEATRIVREMHEWALDELLKIRGVNRIIYKGMTDNHGRHTKKNQWINGHQKSHNWGMYHALAALFDRKKETRVQFEIAEGSLLYADVLGYTFRFAHGHQVSYGGGVGGVSVPGLKWVARSNAGRRAAYTCIGHFHQARFFGPLVVNGSLEGPEAFSTAKGF